MFKQESGSEPSGLLTSTASTGLAPLFALHGQRTFTMPSTVALLDAKFTRAGAALRIEDNDGRTIVVTDYFRTSRPADLLLVDGTQLSGRLVMALASGDMVVDIGTADLLNAAAAEVDDPTASGSGLTTTPAADQAAAEDVPDGAAAAPPAPEEEGVPPADSVDAALELSPGGDENALTGDLILVTQPPAAFDLKPQSINPAGANFAPIVFGDPYALTIHDREYLLFRTPGGFPGEESVSLPPQPPGRLMFWDNGRLWNTLGRWDESSGQIRELPLESTARITTRDFYAAKLDATGATTSQIVRFLETTPSDLTAWAPAGAGRTAGGSAMRVVDPFFLNAGSIIRFDVFFDGITTDAVTEYAVMTVSTGGRTIAVPIRSEADLGTRGGSGWQTLEYTAGVSGDYWFGFASLADQSDGRARLIVDNRRFDRGSVYGLEVVPGYGPGNDGYPDNLGGSTRLYRPQPRLIDPNLSFHIGGGETLLVTALRNVDDPDTFDAPTVALDRAGAGGILTLNSAGEITYTPGEAYRRLAAGQTGSDSFGYIVDGGNGATSTGRVTVTMTGVNDAPEASNDAIATREDQAVGGNVLRGDRFGAGRDSDIDGDPLRVSLVSGPAAGSLQFAADGSFTYTPNADYSGIDSFTYRAADGSLSDEATVTINISPVNDPPRPQADQAVAGENAAIVVDVLANDRDPDPGDVLRIVGAPAIIATSGAGAGQATASLDAGRIRFDPGTAFDRLAAGEDGSATIRYRVRDQGGARADAELLVTIEGVNDAPTAGQVAAAVGEAQTAVAIGVRGAIDDIDSDDDPSTLRIVAVTSAWGTAAVLGTDGRILFEPQAVAAFDALRAGQTATFADAIGFVVEDRHGARATGSVTLTVTGVNDAIVANDDQFAFGEDRAATLAPLANDTDPDQGDIARIVGVEGRAAQVGLTLTLASGALLRLNSDGTFVYNPNGRFEALAVGDTATDSFTYTAADGSGLTDSARVTVTIEGVNDAPLAAPDAAVTDADAAVRIAVLANDADVDAGDVLSIRSVDPTSASIDGSPVADLSFIGDVRINADGTLTYDPEGRFDGLAPGDTRDVSFRYVVEDGFGGRATETATVTVYGVADPQPRRQELISSFDIVDPLIQNSTFPGWGQEPEPRSGLRDIARYDAFNGEFAEFSPTHLSYVAEITGRSGTDLEGALFLPDSLPGDTEDPSSAKGGAAMSTPLSLVAGDRGSDGRLTLSFDWNFLPSAADAAGNIPGSNVRINDYALFSVSNGHGRVPATEWQMFRLADARMVFDEAGLAPGSATGWRTSIFDIEGNFSLPATGDLFLTIGFAVVNDQTPDNPSRLLIDNVRLNRELGPDYGADTLYGGSGVDRLDTFRQNPTAVGDAIAVSRDGAPIRETGAVTLAAAQLLGNDAVSRGASGLRITAFAGLDTGGLATISGDGTSIRYDPRGRFEGLAEGETSADTLRYTVSDANGGTDSATVTLTIAGVNDAPDAFDDAVLGSEDQTLSGSVLGDNGAGADRDIDGDALTISLLSGPAHGTLHLATDGSFTYTPVADFNGGDSFVYRLSDGRTEDHARVTIDVAPVNDLPSAIDDVATTTEDGAVVINVAGNDSDPDGGDVLRPISVAGLPVALGTEIALASGAAVALRADGALVYDPRDGFAGLRAGETASDTFAYAIGDGAGGEDSGSVTVTVTGLNDVPMPVLDIVAANERSPVSVAAASLLANDIDPDLGDRLRLLAIDGAGTIGSVSFNGTTFTYDPAGRFTALGQGQTADEPLLHYTVADEAGVVATGDIRITVTGVNDAPLAVDDVAATREGQPVEINVLANDGDPDTGDVLSLSGLDTAGTRGSVALSANGRFVYDPGNAFDTLAPGQTAVDTFRYSIEDGFGGSDMAEVRVTITGRSNVERIVESFEAPISPANISFGSSGVVRSVLQHQETDGSQILYHATDGARLARLEAFGTSQPNLTQFFGTNLRAQFRDPVDGSFPAQGAGLKFRVDLQAGDELSFDWMFDARDATSTPPDGFADNDFAVFTVSDGVSTSAFKLSDVRATGDFAGTGWRASLYRAEAAGSVTIGFAAVNDRRSDFQSTTDPTTQNSMLLVDNVRVNRDFGEGYQVVDAQADGRFETLVHT